MAPAKNFARRGLPHPVRSVPPIARGRSHGDDPARCGDPHRVLFERASEPAESPDSACRNPAVELSGNVAHLFLTVSGRECIRNRVSGGGVDGAIGGQEAFESRFE